MTVWFTWAVLLTVAGTLQARNVSPAETSVPRTGPLAVQQLSERQLSAEWSREFYRSLAANVAEALTNQLQLDTMANMAGVTQRDTESRLPRATRVRNKQPADQQVCRQYHNSVSFACVVAKVAFHPNDFTCSNQQSSGLPDPAVSDRLLQSKF